jgi:ABC-type oligopeptide transport system ATPase subunit
MPENKSEVLLRIDQLCQYFKTNKAVDGVSFDIYKGEVFGLVGESGCGKTTTGRSIIKLYNITSGSIYFKGKRIAAGTLSFKKAIAGAREEMKTATEERKAVLRQFIAEQRKEMRAARYDHQNCDRLHAKDQTVEVEAKYQPLLAAATGEKREALNEEYAQALRIAKKQRYITQIQMIFQDPIASLDPRMTVYETIAEGLKIRGERDKEKLDKKVFDVLEMVGLVREHAGRYPHEFSGGQRQRIGVARAVVMNPELIIADEPVSALDVSIQAQVINLMDDLRHKLGLTILFIAHDLSVVKYFSDRIGVMYYGKMVELAPSDELFAHPLHPYTRSLLSAIPLPDPIYEKKRQRVKYDPLSEHDYSVDKPQMREILPGHFVQCNDAEYARYNEQLGLTASV